MCFQFKSSRPEVFCKKGVLRNFAKFTGKHLCQRLFFNKKESLAQVFSCKFCEISKNTFFYRTPSVAGSVNFFFYTLISFNLPLIIVVYLFVKCLILIHCRRFRKDIEIFLEKNVF